MFAPAAASWCRVGVKFIAKRFVEGRGDCRSRRLLQTGHFLRLFIKASFNHVLRITMLYLSKGDCCQKGYSEITIIYSLIKILGGSIVIYSFCTVIEGDIV